MRKIIERILTINRLILGFVVIIFPASLSFIQGCSEAKDDDIYTSTGKLADPAELSAGLSTVFTASNKAFDTPADWATGDLYQRFLSGDKLYDDPRVTSNGLGPVYVGYACGSCHINAGRTLPTLFSSGGSGNYGFSSFLTFLRSKNGQELRNYGRVLHDQAVYGYRPEGKLRAEYTEQEFQFDDGEKYALITPHYQVTNWYADSIKPEDLILSIRIPLRHVGLGLMMALDRNELQQLASKSYPEYNISGKLNWITERGIYQIGLSGHKAEHADLTVELGFSSDMGVTSDRYPDEVCKGQEQDPGQHPIEISTKDMADVDFYLQSLGVPARRNVNRADVQKGEILFSRAKCNLCHVSTLHTGSNPPVLIDGKTKMWQLTGQTIHPYSDFLLHDMGNELGDAYPQGKATGNEWRTTPLWGIGLQETVNGHTHFLHDGRARNFTEAIMWHGGEGDASRKIFKSMSQEERAALLEFLKSL